MRSPIRRHERSQFYKYVTAETAALIVRNRRLRWSSPILFNDPFDVPRELEHGFTPSQLRDEIVRTFDQFVSGVETPPGVLGALVQALRAEPRAEVRLAMMASLRHTLEANEILQTKLFDEYKINWREMLPTLRILCLSEVCDSAVMWAHYADQQKGAVLRFECLDALDSATLLAEPVRYDKNPPKLPPVGFWVRAMFDLEKIDWEEFFSEYYYLKSPEWRYEREWRVVTYARPHEPGLFLDVPFRTAELSAVMVGASATGAFVDEMQHELTGELAHVHLLQAELVAATRSVIFRDLR